MVSHDCVAFHLLSEEVSQQVKVVQSGQGADEIFAGYDWYPPLADVPRDGRRRGVRRGCSSTAAHDALAGHARTRSGCSTHDASREFVAAHFGRARRGRPRSTRRCAWTPR